ncbi:MAG: hypothetical protein ACRED1_09520, partial [Limisphaerales bacterium]
MPGFARNAPFTVSVIAAADERREAATPDRPDLARRYSDFTFFTMASASMPKWASNSADLPERGSP